MSNQKGFTFLGMVMLLSTLAVVAVIALRVVPPYIEYFTLKKIVKEVSLTATSESVSDAELRSTFEKRLGINSITRVDGRDLVVERGPQGITVKLAYSVQQPLVAQVSLCIDFEAQGTNKP